MQWIDQRKFVASVASSNSILVKQRRAFGTCAWLRAVNSGFWTERICAEVSSASMAGSPSQDAGSGKGEGAERQVPGKHPVGRSPGDAHASFFSNPAANPQVHLHRVIVGACKRTVSEACTHDVG